MFVPFHVNNAGLNQLTGKASIHTEMSEPPSLLHAHAVKTGHYSLRRKARNVYSDIMGTNVFFLKSYMYSSSKNDISCKRFI